MLETIQHIDETILYFIHVSYGTVWQDNMVPIFRNPYFWSPVYLFLIVMMWRNHRKQGLWWCVFFIVTFAFCDFISASVFKPFIHRLRPCNNVYLSFNIRHLIACGSGFSFPSAHASNHFGFAAFMIITLRHRYKMVLPLAIIWALLVCYAQMYVCVHYPSDILAGAMFGTAIGSFFGVYFCRRFGIPGEIQMNDEPVA